MNICENFTPASGPEGERLRGGAGMHALPPDRKFCPGFCPPFRFPICPCRQSRKLHGHKKSGAPYCGAPVRSGPVASGRNPGPAVHEMEFCGRIPSMAGSAPRQPAGRLKSSAAMPAAVLQWLRAAAGSPMPCARIPHLLQDCSTWPWRNPRLPGRGESPVAAFQTSRFRPDT